MFTTSFMEQTKNFFRLQNMRMEFKVVTEESILNIINSKIIKVILVVVAYLTLL